MKIEKDKFVSIHYTLTDDDGLQIDSSVGKEPLGFVQGNGMIIPGLEAELEGKEAGDKFKAVVKAKDAYGEYNDKLIVELPKSQFDNPDSIEIGMAFQAIADDGTPFIVHVINVTDKTVTIDGNHELAGKNLTFDVEILEVRDSTEADFNQGCGCGGCGGNCGENCGEGGCNGNCDGGNCGNNPGENGGN